MSARIAIDPNGRGWLTVTFFNELEPDQQTRDALRAAGYRYASGAWFGRVEALPAELSPPLFECMNCAETRGQAWQGWDTCRDELGARCTKADQ